MNSYATPDNFKPGERWLAVSEEWQLMRGPFHDVKCLEWSPTKKYVKVQFLTSGIISWLFDTFYLLERLPDESKTNQAAEPARAVEDDSELCQREDCRAIRQELTQRIIHEAAQEIAQGKTFTIATSEEIAASHNPD